MNNLQEYIDFLKAEKSKAEVAAEKNRDLKHWYSGEALDAAAGAFDLAITKAELLLDIESNNGIPPQLHKHDVMRWVEFEKQKPEYMQCCLITNEFGSVIEAQYTGESNLFIIGMDEYRAKAWMEMPPPFV